MNPRNVILAGVAGLAASPLLLSPAHAATNLATTLPANWYADSGTPVAWNDTHVWLYDDAFDKMGPDMFPAPDAEIHRNAVVIDGQWITDPLPQLADGGYWWQDGFELPDGSLFVLLTEFKNDWTLPPPMQFVPVDTDAIIVRDPSSEWSWRYAREHGMIEQGPWGDDSVQFVDGTNLAVARDQFDGLFGVWTDTQLFEYDPADPAAWERLTSNLPRSGAVFVPVQTATGWWGLSWGLSDEPGVMDWHTVTLWCTPADKLGTDTPWVLADDWSTVTETHYHTLLVVEGDVYWRTNNLDGSRRPEYDPVNLNGRACQ